MKLNKQMEHKIKLKEIAKVFAKLGIIGFGGPAAHIAMMRDEVVVKRKWMSEQHFLDLLGLQTLFQDQTVLFLGELTSRLVLYSACRFHNWNVCILVHYLWTVARSTAFYLRNKTSHNRHYFGRNLSIGKAIYQINKFRFYRYCCFVGRTVGY